MTEDPASSTAVPAVARGAPRRVAEVHAQARAGLGVAAAFTVASLVAAAVHDSWWLPLHLFVVGGLLSAISAAAQMLAVTWSASPAPRRSLAAAQRGTLAVGAVAMVAGREAQHDWVFAAGGIAVILAMATLAAILWHVRARAVTERYVPAVEAYVAALLAGTIGMGIGVVLGLRQGGTRTIELRGAHLVLNVFGLVGLVIAGTVPYFAATQLRAKMSPRATPQRMRVTFLLLAGAVGVAAIGRVLDDEVVSAAGLICYALGLVGVAAMLPVVTREKLRWAGPRMLQLLAGLAWWAAMAVGLATTILRSTSDRTVLQVLVVGGFAQILVASLAYLGPVLRGGGHQRLSAGFATTRSWVSLAAGNAAAVGAFVGSRVVLSASLAVWLVDGGVRAARLLLGGRRPASAPPRSA